MPSYIPGIAPFISILGRGLRLTLPLQGNESSEAYTCWSNEDHASSEDTQSSVTPQREKSERPGTLCGLSKYVSTQV